MDRYWLMTLIGHTDDVTAVAFMPDAKRIVSGSRDNTIKLWDAATGQETFSLKAHLDDVTGISISPDGQQIASSSLDHHVKVWDASSRVPNSLSR